MTMLASPPVTGSISPDAVADMDGLFELVDGRLVEKQTSFLSAKTAGFVAAILVPFARERDLGDVVVEATFCCFPNKPGQVRRPDLAFIAAARATRVPDEGNIPIAPDLAVEIVSPGDSVYEMDDKLIDYKAAGIPMIWIINPQAKSVRIFRPGKPIEELNQTDQLTGDAILPGFSTQVSELFPAPVRSA